MASIRVKTPASHSHTRVVARTGPACYRRPLAPCRTASSEQIETQLPGKLLDLFCVVQHPTISNRPYSKALEAFVDECIMTYECGYTEGDLEAQAASCAAERRHLYSRSGLPEPPDMVGYCEQDFLDCVRIVWCTLIVMKGVTRWALSPAVTESTLQRWRTFVTMIITAYVEKRMRWYPIERLQLEMAAMQGLPLPHDTVAERARLVFTTLERIYPQFAE